MIEKANVNVATGKIYNCKKNSWIWYHEKGHLEFEKEYSFMKSLDQISFYSWMFFIMLSFRFKFALALACIIWGVNVCFLFYEEYWCNQYADRHFKKKKVKLFKG